MLKLQQSDKPSFSFWLVEPQVTIGRSASNDIVLDDHSLHQEHALIKVVGEQLQLVTQAESISVNGRLVSGLVELNVGDTLHLGRRAFVIVDPKDSIPLVDSVVEDQWCIVPVKADAAVVAFSLFDNAVIGRADSCDLQIKDAHLSRRHARIVFRSSKPWLEDLGSANGTSVNGKRVQNSALNVGDIVSFDKQSFRVEHKAADLNKTSVRAMPVVTEAQLAGAAGQRAQPKSAVMEKPDTARQPFSHAIPVQAQVMAEEQKKPSSQLVLTISCVILIATAVCWMLF